MTSYSLADSLHRLVKHALDTGAASSVAEAEAMFRRYSLTFTIDTAEARDPLHQAALLTGVALARRVFLGGVAVTGAVNEGLLVPLPLGTTLAEAISASRGIANRLVGERSDGQHRRRAATTRERVPCENRLYRLARRDRASSLRLRPGRAPGLAARGCALSGTCCE